MAYELINGDCIEVMSNMEDCSVDSIVTDPPYGLSFMGKDWDDPSKMVGQVEWGTPGTHTRGYVDVDMVKFQRWTEAWAKEAFRILKPGGHIISFAGSRTYHRMACAIEDAGFEIRDQIMWLYGTGFPKSLNVSKAIDKAAGRYVDGEVLPSSRKVKGPSGFQMKEKTSENPQTDEAKQWAGWGTALKPAHEPCVLARKPLVGTVTENVLEHGTGALNIDGCRIGVGEEVIQGGGNGKANHGGRFGAETNGERPIVQPHNKGRWPANIVLSHHPECTRVGLKTVKGNGHAPALGKGSPFGGINDTEREEHHFNEEVVENWECVEGCPVGLMPDSSTTGKRTEKSAAKEKKSGDSHIGWHSDRSDKEYNDTGSAARFFFSTEAASEQWECVVDCPVRILDEQAPSVGNAFSSERKTDTTGGTGNSWSTSSKNAGDGNGVFDGLSGASKFFYCAKPSKSERNAGLDELEETARSLVGQTHWTNECGDCGRRWPQQESVCLKCGGELVRESRDAPTAKNHHPTVKPVDLMRYLCRLITPPGGVVLDPFMGSGTTGIAATNEGFRFIGIEMEEDYIDIARRRIAHWVEEKEVVLREQRAQRSLFDF